MTYDMECQNITVRFGSFVAVSDVSFSFKRGRVYGIIGPNGAGKTTLMNSLVGGLRPAVGSIRLLGRDVTNLDVSSRARLGMGRSFQISKIFASMSVFENLRLAAQVNAFRFQPAWRPAYAYRELNEEANAMLVEIGLERHANTFAEKLSHGEQRALELGLAIMTRPKVLLLDEPLAGVGRHGISEALSLLARIVKGRTVLLIEHNVEAVMQLADEIIVMAGGKVLASGSPDEIRHHDGVRAAYLGTAS